MIVICGKTCSGKDTIVKELVKNHGYKKIVTYTTRPPRNGEKNNLTYHFIDEEEFKSKIAEDFFAEWKSYHTVSGEWFYGLALADVENTDNKSITILTPQGYLDLCESVEYEPTCFYIYANDSTIKKRLTQRGDDKSEANRRIEHDREDFKGFESVATKIIYNNDGTKLEDVVAKIVKYAEECIER